MKNKPDIDARQFDLSASNYSIRSNCRLCLSSQLSVELSLPSTPLANEFTRDPVSAASQALFPLYLARCDQCHHVQLPVVVDPERLFRNYVYVSGTSLSFVKHLQDQGREIVFKYLIPQQSLIVEIGSNDGTALLAYKELGMRVLGIDPAYDIAAAATRGGVRTIPEFFTRQLAETIQAKEGFAKVIIANNVFAHVDDLIDIADGVALLLEPETGLFVFEVQYLIDMIENGYFDMIYHEHLSYHTIEPLKSFLEFRGLSIVNVTRVKTHGGSIRVICRKGLPSPSEKVSVEEIIQGERDALLTNPLNKISVMIEQAKEDLDQFFDEQGGVIWGFGAPAKLTTLFYGLGLDSNRFHAIIDDNPLKQNMFSPGKGIPIISKSRFLEIADDGSQRILIFAWNFASQIKAGFDDSRFTFFKPLPRLARV